MLAVRRAVSITCLIAFAALAAAAETHASPAPPTLRAGDRLDGPAFQLLIPTAAPLEIRIAIGADVDADGDVDLVASTDRGLVVWINDGAGHFRRKTGRRHAVVDGPAAPDTWRGDGTRSAETVLTGTLLVPLIVACAHAPPSPPAQRLASDRHHSGSDRSTGTRTPRAPPTRLA